MRFRNSGKGEENILQNRFTKYLMTSIHRKKMEILQKRSKINIYEQLQDSWEQLPVTASESMLAPDLFEQIDLSQALKRVSKRDRYIFFAHVLEERGFSELAAELGMGYKGVAAAYYRTIQKIRQEMESDVK